MKLPQKKSTPTSGKPEDNTEPEERRYVFRTSTGPGSQDYKDDIVPESELSHEQTGMLANQLWRTFTEMPDIVKDLFLARVDLQILADRQKVEAASKKKGAIVGVDGLPVEYGSIIKGEA